VPSRAYRCLKLFVPERPDAIGIRKAPPSPQAQKARAILRSEAMVVKGKGKTAAEKEDIHIFYAAAAQ
jgi:hypothetical protein